MAYSIASGEGGTYRRDTVTVLWAISFMIVNASAPVSPRAFGTGPEKMQHKIRCIFRRLRERVAHQRHRGILQEA
jgi:hypothetical protein